MATDESEPVSAGASLVRELTENILGAGDEKVATTLRLKRSTWQRLKEQERRWSTSMSHITERALEPVLEQLEVADPPMSRGKDGR